MAFKLNPACELKVLYQGSWPIHFRPIFIESDCCGLAFFKNKPVVSLVFLNLETLARPIVLLIYNLACHIWYVFSTIVQFVVCSHKLVFRWNFIVDLLNYFPKFRAIKKKRAVKWATIHAQIVSFCGTRHVSYYPW